MVAISRNELRTRAFQLPRQPLAFLPTPLIEAPRLAEAIGDIRLFVKREDCSGLAFGGNKTRMLEFTVGAAVAAGADCIVAAAKTHSNHCRQAAAAAAKLGLECVLVLGQEPTSGIFQGNAVLQQLLGATIETVPSGDLGDIQRAAEAVVQRMRAQNRRACLVTLRPENRALGAVAHATAFVEVQEQLEALEARADALYVASSGPTYAGYLLGARATGATTRIVGIAPEGTLERATRAINEAIEGGARLLELENVGQEPALDVHFDFLGPGYGLPSDRGLAAFHLAAEREGLILDPVYTSKGLSGLIAHVQSGRIRTGSTVVFVHTGGTPAVFTHAEALTGTGRTLVSV